MERNITEEINRLKRQKKSILLAHYYTPAEVQALADYVGDSYYLAKVAKNTDAEIVVFCGVAFMGESVKILNPEKKVLMPDMTADCPMAHMAQIEKIKELRARYEDLAVVCYINSTAELKCHSDVCVTSSNAVKIVKALPNRNVFFIPDENLGRFVQGQVPEKNVILNDGCCPIHAAVSAEQLKAMKEKYPDALVLTHPECREEIVALSDYVGSTAEILSYANGSENKQFIICTESGVGYALEQKRPDHEFIFVTDPFCCADMKLNTPEKVLRVLETEENEVLVSDEKRKRALLPLDRMLEIVG